MLTIHPDFRDLLTCFNSKGVRYLVIGGYAANFHGHHRNTKDFDVWIAVDPENADRVSDALQAFGFKASSVPSSMFARPGTVWAFGREPMRIDILTRPTGIDFESCYPRRVLFDLDGLAIPFIGLEDFIVNKRASGRAQDFADVEALTGEKLHARPKRRPRKK